MKWDFIRVSGTALPPFEKFREARGARQTTSRDKKVSRDLKHPQDRGFRAAFGRLSSTSHVVRDLSHWFTFLRESAENVLLRAWLT